jgi:uncharacterized membrane protein
MANEQYQHAIGTFPTREHAEAALRELRDADFNMDKISVIAQNADSQERMEGKQVQSSEEQAAEGAVAGVTGGTLIGSFLGLIGGLGVVAIPGLGAAAEVGIVLANTLLGSGVGAAGGGIIGALIGWGLPEDQARYYKEMLSQGNYVVMLEGTEREVKGAEAILQNRLIRDWNIYYAPTNHPYTGMGMGMI